MKQEHPGLRLEHEFWLLKWILSMWLRGNITEVLYSDKYTDSDVPMYCDSVGIVSNVGSVLFQILIPCDVNMAKVDVSV